MLMYCSTLKVQMLLGAPNLKIYAWQSQQLKGGLIKKSNRGVVGSDTLTVRAGQEI